MKKSIIPPTTGLFYRRAVFNAHAHLSSVFVLVIVLVFYGRAAAIGVFNDIFADLFITKLSCFFTAKSMII